MSDDALAKALQNQGSQLVSRAEWLQKMIERNTGTIANCQKTIEFFAAELHATNSAIDALRSEYRKHVSDTKREPE